MLSLKSATALQLLLSTVLHFYPTTSAETVIRGKGAVVTNGHDCATIGTNILEKGGAAVDAAIAALFCEGVSIPESSGIGGGFLMTIFDKESGKVVSLNAREVAPGNATENMFGTDRDLASKGGLSVAVPGQLRGYWEAYKKYGGKVPWNDLVQPTIDLCRNGILVTPYLESVLRREFEQLNKDPYLKEVFINPRTNRVYKENEFIKMLRLADTLEIIAKEGGDVLHNGSLTKQFAEDIQNAGGMITEEDLNNYKPEWQQPVKSRMPFGQTLYTAPLPGSGVILTFILNILNNYLDYSRPNFITNWQRIIESFKFAFAERPDLGDPNFVDVSQVVANLTSLDYAKMIRLKINDRRTSQNPKYYGANTTQTIDHGSTQTIEHGSIHISVLAENGDAVSVTSTINQIFGAGFMAPSSGIILNNQMEDFSSPNVDSGSNVPPRPANFIRPGKRPLSSMSPSIILGRDNEVRMIVGAAGVTTIVTSVTQTIIKHLWFNKTVSFAINDRRLHHQLFPMELQLEPAFRKEPKFVSDLRQIGHWVKYVPVTGFSAVTAISIKNGFVSAAFDDRRGGDKRLLV